MALRSSGTSRIKTRATRKQSTLSPRCFDQHASLHTQGNTAARAVPHLARDRSNTLRRSAQVPPYFAKARGSRGAISMLSVRRRSTRHAIWENSSIPLASRSSAGSWQKVQHPPSQPEQHRQLARGRGGSKRCLLRGSNSGQ